MHACGLPTAPTQCAAVTPLHMLDFNVGKGGQGMKYAIALSGVLQKSCINFRHIAAVRAGYVLERALVILSIVLDQYNQ